MRKILLSLSAAAGFFIFAAVLIFFFRSGRAEEALPPQLAPVKSGDNAPTAPGAEPAAEAPISGQVLYDARASLPPQAVLEVKLTETDAQTGSAAIIAETRRQPDGASPLSWVLPIKLSALDKHKTYALQAKISGGDTLLFVNDAPTELDYSRAAYIIRLAKIDNSGGLSETRGLVGTEWRAAALGDKIIEKESAISLKLESMDKTDPAGSDTYYRLSGAGNCNRYSAAATVNETDKKLEFTPLSTVLIACLPAAARQEEAEFSAIINKTRFYKIDESGALYLLNAEQSPLARFIAAPQ